MEEQIYIIIAKILNGEGTQEDEAQLDAWLAADEGNRAIYEKMQEGWEDADKFFAEPNFETEKAWNKVFDKISTHNTNNNTLPFFPSWTKYAAGIAAVFLIGLFIFKFTNNDTILAADNENRDIMLPDSSHITLRKGSSLKYDKSFAVKDRHVTLSGEAFFEVTHNTEKPFIIDAGAAAVKVVGTSFNVITEKNNTEVVVLTGKVLMKPVNNNDKKVFLTKGMKGTLAGERLTQEKVDPQNYLFWKTGKLVFKNALFSNIINTLSKQYHINIKFSADMPDKIKTQLVTISFNHRTAEETLQELCLITQCKWEKVKDVYIIRSNK